MKYLAFFNSFTVSLFFLALSAIFYIDYYNWRHLAMRLVYKITNLTTLIFKSPSFDKTVKWWQV